VRDQPPRSGRDPEVEQARRDREANVATYADVTVVCGPVEREPELPTHSTNRE
jgi:hypothetical protein